eukprot:SAG25_NODE_4244_length_857_cov_1.274406_1_plen_63_part_10
MGVVWWTNLMQLPYIANRPGSQEEVLAFAFKQCLMSWVWWAFENPVRDTGGDRGAVVANDQQL